MLSTVRQSTNLKACSLFLVLLTLLPGCSLPRVQSQDKNNQAEKVEALSRVYSAHGEYQSSAKKFIRVSSWQQGCSPQYQSAAREAAQKARELLNMLKKVPTETGTNDYKLIHRLQMNTVQGHNQIAQLLRSECKTNPIGVNVNETLTEINVQLDTDMKEIKRRTIDKTPSLWPTSMKRPEMRTRA